MPVFGPYLAPLLFLAVVASLFIPGVLDFALGIVCFVGIAWGWSVQTNLPPGQDSLGVVDAAIFFGLCGLFGGGAIAWGWLSAARATAVMVCLRILATERDGNAVGLAILLGLFAATGWLATISSWPEHYLWSGTARPASRSTVSAAI